MLDDAALQDKLEATRRKLKERYQQVENGLPFLSQILCYELTVGILLRYMHNV